MSKDQPDRKITTNCEEVLNHQPASCSRRDFVRSLTIAAGAGAALAAQSSSAALAAPEKSNPGRGDDPPGAQNNARSNEAYGRRVESAKEQRRLPDPSLDTNGDETAYPDFIGNFSKTLPHNAYGEVDPAAYRSLLRALQSGRLEDFDAVPAGGPRILANPRAAYSFALAGADPHKIDMPAVHAFDSKRQAAEAGEVYWMALARDVKFADYDSSPITQAAAADMSAFSDFTGPKDGNGNVTTQTLFRGLTPGDLAGPYISEFLLLDVPFGNKVVPQVAFNPVVGDDHMTDFASWLAVQRGQLSGIGNQLENTVRPIERGRDLAEYVHQDFTYQAYLNAALICLGFGDALDPNEYSIAAREGGFITFGGAAVVDLVARAARIALRPAWFQKWLVHRKLRPEAFGGRVENVMAGDRNYPIDNEFLSSEALLRVFGMYGNGLLPQAYPEGSPTHPSYPAGHALVAGASVTVLKAFFYEDYVIPGSNGLTIGGELNKLASNIALGRNMAGVHWRADGDDGLRAGEAIAISLLQDELRMVTEEFIGFALTTFDGEDIFIEP